MSKRINQRYDISLKQQVVSEVVEQGKRQCDVARSYGLSDKLVSSWVSVYKSGTAWARSDNQKAQDKDYYLLQRENKRLKQENEILKKASAYFAKNLR